MALDRYREKRDFDHTPEPAGDGQTPGSAARIFVVQKHAASRLHYDFRLETGGVLASWAVPKGPSLDTRDRRLAVHVEDHPLEYGSFEGTIPQGEYGGGTVMVWDRGTYEPKGDFDADLAAGKAIKFVLHGEKLKGGFTLVHLKPREGERGDNWLLIKERDEHTRTREEYDVTQARPESVASGRDLDQISSAGKPGTVPDTTPMQLAQLASKPPEGDGWIREPKLDGYRLRAVVSGGKARLLTRSGQDWTDRFGHIATASAALEVSSAILDGEVVAYGRGGVPDFSALQSTLAGHGEATPVYMVFDLLELDGQDLRGMNLAERKRLLANLLAGAPYPLRYVDHLESAGERFHAASCELGLEGSVSKRGDKPYRPGRTPDWQKVKCLHRQEFVVGGFTEPGGTRQGFGALLLGLNTADGLSFAGRVGTGFSGRDIEHIGKLLSPLARKTSPFAEPVSVPGKRVHWVQPELVVEVRFQEWTPEGRVRHPSFMGLREDKPATHVTAEENRGDSDAGEAPGTAERIAGDSTVAGVRLSSPDKMLFEPGTNDSSEGVTKLDLAHYYERVAGLMLPLVANRPLTLVRCPHGSSKDCFYQKHPDNRTTLAHLQTVTVNERSGPAQYLYVDDVAGLIELVQLGTLEIHTWNSKAESPEKPDQVVFDLDPGPGIQWNQIASAALHVRDVLGALELPAFLKSTGGSGLHVVVPLVPGPGYGEIRTFARALVERIATNDPKNFTARMAKSARPGRIYLDYLRNAHGATAVAPYSTRARPGAPISVPLAWDDLDAPDPPVYDVRTTQERTLKHAQSAWSDFETARTEITSEILGALGV